MSPVLHLFLLPLLFCVVSTGPCSRVIMRADFLTVKQNVLCEEKVDRKRLRREVSALESWTV